MEDALESLSAQTFRDFETIITDDASDDGTADVIENWLSRTGFPAHFIRNSVNRGICANRNTALAIAKGRYICSLAGDDAYHPERIERQAASFLTQPANTAAVYSDAILVDEHGRELGLSYMQDKLRNEARPEGDIFRKLLLDDIFLPSPAVMVRRSSLEAVGLYDESLFFEDLYMWLKLSNRFRFHFEPGGLVRYRVHSNSMSRNPTMQSKMLESTFRVLKAWTGKCGDAEEALNERLWHLAMKQLLTGDKATTRRMMAVAAGCQSKWHRWMTARLCSFSAGCEFVRSVTRAYG